MAIVDNIRLSGKARDQLLTLKRYTGIKHWNVLCRWALCTSLAEPKPPSAFVLEGGEQVVEMTWQVFGGVNAEVYEALIRQRCHRDGLPLDDETLADQLRLHLYRGISYLAGDRSLRNIGDLMHRALGAPRGGDDERAADPPPPDGDQARDPLEARQAGD